MENLFLSPNEHKFVLKFKNFLEWKFNVSISIPESLSSCSRDVVVVTVLGRKTNFVRNFIRRKMAQMRQKQEQNITVRNNITTITLCDSDSDSSSPALMEPQRKRRKRRNRNRPYKCSADKEKNQFVDLSSTILIEDSEESANENSVQETSNAEKENMKFNERDSVVNVPIKVETECPVTSTNFIPLDDAQISQNTSLDKSLDNTIILSDSPPPSDFIPLFSKKQKKKIPNGIDDSDIIIEDEIKKPIVIKTRCLRPVVIDGSNVAREHGKVTNTYSCKGIQIAINYFLQKGHSQVTAFVPHFRRHSKFGPVFTTDQPLLEELAREQRVVFTPSRRIDNKRVTCYDDRFIVELATKTGGVILSNDNYRDLAAESEDFKKTINERLLMFCFVGDIIMIPQDPLGRQGPSLENFLSFPT